MEIAAAFVVETSSSLDWTTPPPPPGGANDGPGDAPPPSSAAETPSAGEARRRARALELTSAEDARRMRFLALLCGRMAAASATAPSREWTAGAGGTGPSPNDVVDGLAGRFGVTSDVDDDGGDGDGHLPFFF